MIWVDITISPPWGADLGHCRLGAGAVVREEGGGAGGMEPEQKQQQLQLLLQPDASPDASPDAIFFCSSPDALLCLLFF
jgi:hypothetical protein